MEGTLGIILVVVFHIHFYGLDQLIEFRYLLSKSKHLHHHKPRSPLRIEVKPHRTEPVKYLYPAVEDKGMERNRDAVVGDLTDDIKVFDMFTHDRIITRWHEVRGLRVKKKKSYYFTVKIKLTVVCFIFLMGTIRMVYYTNRNL